MYLSSRLSQISCACVCVQHITFLYVWSKKSFGGGARASCTSPHVCIMFIDEDWRIGVAERFYIKIFCSSAIIYVYFRSD